MPALGSLPLAAGSLHFIRWFHHFRWIIVHRYGVVHSVSDPEMLADVLTKCVNPAKFHLFAGLRGS